METPAYLIGQLAAERGVSPNTAKRVLYLRGLAAEARTTRDVADVLGLAPATVKDIARRFMIDLADYRPYARRRDAGEVIPERSRNIHMSADHLPLFGGKPA